MHRAFKNSRARRVRWQVLEVLLTERGEGPEQWCGDKVPEPTVLQQQHDHVIPSHQLKEGSFARALRYVQRAFGTA